MSQSKDIFMEGENIENLFSDDLSPFLKWGMTWLFLVGIALFSLTWFIKYPEVIKAPAILTTDESPKALVPKLQAKIAHLYIGNGDTVLQGDVLATLESSALSEDIAQLESLIIHIDTVYQKNMEDVVGVSLDYFQLSNLGDIQPAYEQFQRSYSELKFVLSDAFLSTKLSLLRQRTQSLKKMNFNLRLQRNTIYENYQLSEATHAKEKRLFEQGSITAYELKESKSQLLNRRLSYQNTKNAIIQNERQQQDIVEQRIQLTQSIEQQKNNFVQAFKNLKSTYIQWKNTYQLTSSIDGVVSVPVSTQPHALVSPNAPALYVLPQGAEPVVHVRLPQYNLNQIDTTKGVRIRLTAYPYEEFGVLEGRVASISRIPVEGQYDAVVKLNNGLISSFNKDIDFMNGLGGEAEIILNDERLIVRFFRKVKQV